MTTESWLALADAILGFEDDGVVAVISQAYFDESGNSGSSPVMVVAGYLFRKSDADTFSKLWTRQLKRYGIPFAHMTDCQAVQSFYKNLDEHVRYNICKSLMALTKTKSAIGVSVGIMTADYSEEMKSVMTPYSYLLTRAVMLMREMMQRQRFKGDVVYLFESGHDDASESDELMHRLGKMGDGIANFYRYAGHGFVKKKAAPPLQAADMLAWFHQHYLKTIIKGSPRLRPDAKFMIRDTDNVMTISRKDLVDDFANMSLAHSPDPLAIMSWDTEFLTALTSP